MINSVQRGVTSIQPNQLTQNVTIQAVNLSKSFVTINDVQGITAPIPGVTGRTLHSAGRLTSSTNLEFRINFAPSYVTPTIVWEVVEFQ